MDTELDLLEQSLRIPVLGGLQAQGDLIVVPSAMLATPDPIPPEPGWRDVPPEGIVLLRSAGGGNPHTLVAEPGTCRWTTSVRFDGLSIGAFEATADVYLIHPEHGASGVAPGTYVVRRQREHDRLRGGSRLVAD
jgi:hypothetical protein